MTLRPRLTARSFVNVDLQLVQYQNMLSLVHILSQKVQYFQRQELQQEFGEVVVVVVVVVDSIDLHSGNVKKHWI